MGIISPSFAVLILLVGIHLAVRLTLWLVAVLASMALVLIVAGVRLLVVCLLGRRFRQSDESQKCTGPRTNIEPWLERSV